MQSFPPFPAPVLLAAGLDWLEGLLPVVFVLIWIVSQVMAMFRNAAGKPGGGPAGRPANLPRPAAPPLRPVVGERGNDVDREIEEFLQRSLRGVRPPKPAVPVKPAARPQVRSRPAKPKGDEGPRRGSGSPAPAQVGSRPSGLESQRAGGLTGHGGDVAEHVAAAFAHDLAHEAPSATGAASVSAGPSMADELVAALQSPADLRRLLVLREVLDRPTQRW